MSPRSVKATHAELWLERSYSEAGIQRRSWGIKRPSGETTFETPTIFASFSISGNQWLKLLYFYDEWRGWLNLLVSQADMYRCRPGFRNELAKHGIRAYLPWKAERVGRSLASQSKPQAYHRYARSRPNGFGPYKGLVMLDSGGFTFGNLKKLKLLRSRTSAACLSETANALEREKKLELSRSWTTDKAHNVAREAQVAHLRFGVTLRPDFLVALDRIIESPSMPVHVKRRRAFFGISCATEGLKFLSKLRRCNSVFLPVVHPYGPYGAVFNGQVARNRAVNFYEGSVREQIERLEDAESETGVMYGGLAIGSLVPFENATMVPIVGEALARAIRSSTFANRFVHCFGANNDKLELLLKYGVHSFDTNHHVKLARARRMYDPSNEAYALVRGRRLPRCDCAVCRVHGPSEFRETHKGLKEVPTVLMALHNFETNHLERVGWTRRARRKA